MLRVVCLILTFSVCTLARQATINEHPYHVTIESPGGQVCNGVLLSANTIFTSASCTYEMRLLKLSVRAGTDRLKEGGTVRELKSLTPHHDYQPNGKDFDIALGFVDNSFPLGDKIGRIVLPQFLESPRVPSLAVLVGWGVDGNINNTETLTDIEMKVSVHNDCKNVYASHHINITEDMFCAKPTKKNVNPCKGRSGSPLVAGNILVGLCAWEESGEKYPGIYADISSVGYFATSEMESKSLLT